MEATKFEFGRRFWIIAAIYAIGFSLSPGQSFINQLRHCLAPEADPRLFTRLALLLGALLVFGAAALRTWAAAFLRSDIVHDPQQHSDTLLADGPFRFTRNPLYFASLPMAAGVGLLASTAGLVWLVLANWIFVYRLIFREEATLTETQGGSYQAYLKTVPRFWPSLIPRLPAGGATPRWAQAFFGETFIWMFAVAVLAIAITLNAKIGMGIFAAGFATHFFTNRRLLRRG